MDLNVELRNERLFTARLSSVFEAKRISDRMKRICFKNNPILSEFLHVELILRQLPGVPKKTQRI